MLMLVTFAKRLRFAHPMLVAGLLLFSLACSDETVVTPLDSTALADAPLRFPGQDSSPSPDQFVFQDLHEDDDCLLLAWFPDNDLDGYGTKEGSIHSCSQKAGYVAGTGDCNDADKDIFPGNPEVCDGKDNDCNGDIDDGIQCDGTCTDGQTQPCGLWDTGECEFGTTECINGNWGPCTGEVGPKPEVCDGKDNDCDGTVDDGIDCSCEDGSTDTCGESDIGECALGTLNCVDGVWGPCQGAIGPTQEICDDKDNDCDGKTDNDCVCPEGETMPCGTNTGLCKAGLQTCIDGVWSECVGEIPAAEESCDGQDNDCDGATDEDCDCLSGDTKPCGTNTGECQAGTMSCTNGKWGDCEGEIAPQNEACDGKDNDCDGETDEVCDCQVGDTEPCGKDTGECQSGTRTCANGTWGSCEGEVLPKAEICDGKDNDCDGETDETCECQPGDTKPCGLSQGECQEGSQSCVNGSWGACSGQIPPAPEVCDGKDNNCDGQVDEGVKNTYYLDSDKDGYGSDETVTTACKPPAGYKKDSGDCDDNNASVHPAASEVCDAWDNDCDDLVNEGNVCKNCISSKTTGKKLCPVSSFALPVPYVQGMAWVPTTQHLWVNALSEIQGSSTLYKVTAEGSVVATYPFPASFPKDLAFDGQFLWSTALFPGMIYKFNLNGTKLAEFAMKNNELPSGIAWMGSYFKIISLVALMQQDYHLWKYTGSTNFTAPIAGACPAGETCFFNGMTQREGDLWHTTAQGEIEQRTEAWVLLDEFVLQGNLMDSAPIGIAWDGAYFWVGEAGTGNIFKLLYY
jgi:hypothetical protein